MYTAFLIGNIASGKSTAARYLEQKGARRIDLDQMAKDLYIPGSEMVASLADAFGSDILDANGAVRTSVLAERAFADAESTRMLNDLVHPALLDQLSHILLPANCCSTVILVFPLTVVEVSAPEGFTDAFGLADEVVAITAPRDVRRERARARGMAYGDFDARADVQPTEEDLCALATTVIDNTDAGEALFAALDAWLVRRGIALGNDPVAQLFSSEDGEAHA